MRRLPAILTLHFLLNACDGGAASDPLPADGASTSDVAPDAEPPADAAGAGDAGVPDAGEQDAGAADAAWSFAEDCPRGGEGRCAAVDWIASLSAYPDPVDHHTTLIAEAGNEAFLMVFGGIRSTDLGGIERVYDAVRRARIDRRGDLEPFADEAPLPLPLAFHAQARHGDFVYLLGGVTAGAAGPEPNTTALVGRLVDGRVAEWRTAALPREVRVHPTAELLAGRVVLIGGSGSGGAVLDSVASADLGEDGLPGPFTPVAPLPAPRSHHASVVANGHLYVIGGFGPAGAPRSEVLRAAQDAHGRVVGWDVVAHLDEAPWTASAFVHRGWLGLVGGGEGEGGGAHFVGTVRAAPLLPDGGLGPFEVVDDALPVARSHVHQTPVHRGAVYSVGGRADGADGLRSINRVFIGALW